MDPRKLIEAFKAQHCKAELYTSEDLAIIRALDELRQIKEAALLEKLREIEQRARECDAAFGEDNLKLVERDRATLLDATRMYLKSWEDECSAAADLRARLAAEHERAQHLETQLAQLEVNFEKLGQHASSERERLKGQLRETDLLRREAIAEAQSLRAELVQAQKEIETWKQALNNAQKREAEQRHQMSLEHGETAAQLSQAERDKAALEKIVRALGDASVPVSQCVIDARAWVAAKDKAPRLAEFEAFRKAVCDGVTATMPDAVALKFCMCKPYAPLIVKASTKAGCEIWRSDDDSGPLSYSDVACVLNAVAAAEAEILAAHRDTKPEQP